MRSVPPPTGTTTTADTAPHADTNATSAPSGDSLGSPSVRPAATIGALIVDIERC